MNWSARDAAIAARRPTAWRCVRSKTPFGRKRAIDQSSCNKDFTCLDGFCPSFVTVRGGTLRKAAKPETASGGDPAAGLPIPAAAGFDVACNVLLGGIGGTGVITVGALLGVAAHLDGLAVSVLDQTGLAQKNGAVGSHVRIARSAGHLAATRIGAGMTDVLLGFDMITAASREMISTLSRDRSHAVVNSHLVPLASFAEQPDMSIDGGGYRDAISAQIGAERATMLNATHLAERIIGRYDHVQHLHGRLCAPKGISPGFTRRAAAGGPPQRRRGGGQPQGARLGTGRRRGPAPGAGTGRRRTGCPAARDRR